ncbi:transcriptional regulator, LacI family [Marinitoga hydrogenitolerans DSM 16785]|uniref:Transcriptional regulator, LacI family n=1 Tax=Marinitoga hydrogenitolerans (strain DSM 16785 / JCM 12826 / AT1271) TaxID=1122195 RepID=A0A1M4VI47_MARH1|nr:LacI family DNA-binding transcriptional regulator [Marinitoga hydrogenitolerans]SHE68701.1 transcriptional regulator, LacI family [Marinitoga hydrogenitolerans DSM 16785]
MKRASIRDVAKEAGVSISTVSRVINNSSYVNEELKIKVEQAIKKLNYKPNIIAQSLRKGKTKTIGFVIPDITNPFFPNIVKGVEDYLKKEGYTLLLSNSDQDLEMETKIINTFISKHIDGIIFTGTGSYNPVLEKLIEKGIKIVFLDRILEGINASYVICDNKSGILELLNYLYNSGKRSFYFVNGNQNTFSARIRYETFLEFMKEKKIKKYNHIYTNFSYEAGYKFGKNIKSLPEVIIGGNDLIAYGIIDSLQERKIKIPEDVSVTGFDDILFSKHYKPSLTTVKQPIYEMGYKAAELMLKIINGKQKKIKGIVLKPELIIRESTK